MREVAGRLGISTKSLYAWKAEFSKPHKVRDNEAALASEVRQLKRELARVSAHGDPSYVRGTLYSGDQATSLDPSFTADGIQQKHQSTQDSPEGDPDRQYQRQQGNFENNRR